VEMLPTSTTAMFVRLAGLSGAVALALGAYGAHGLHGREDISPRQKQSFDTANRLHLVHSAVLLAAGSFRHPRLSGAMFVVGTSLFCGSCYNYAITGNEPARKVAPVGGMILILAWLSLAL